MNILIQNIFQENTSKEFHSSSLKNNFLPKLMNLDEIKYSPNYNINELSNENKIIKIGRKKLDSNDYEENKEFLNNSSITKNVVHDKYSNDNMRRKIKTFYHNYIINLLNNLMKRQYPNNKMKFLKINKRITEDLGIEYNRNLLNKPIKDIVINISNRYSNKDNNINCIKYIEKQKNNEEIINILNITYKDFYINYYLKSNKNNSLDNSFEVHKEKILKLNGKEYLNKFIENTKNFIEFFIKGKKRKSRKPKEIDVINIPLNEKNNEISINDINNNKDKKMISSSTQTDICGINVKLIAFY